MLNPFSSYIESGDFIQVCGDSGRSGAEWHGACPLCGAGSNSGKNSDQFVCWPDHPKKKDSGGGWFCRGCTDGKLQSGIDFLIRRDGLSVAEAFRVLGLQKSVSPVPRVRRLPTYHEEKRDEGAAAHGVIDSNKWTAAAQALLSRCQKALERDQAARSYLHGRGFTDESIKLYGFGYVPSTQWAKRPAWGLEQSDGKDLWIPQGWVIPIFEGKGHDLVGLKIRRPNEAIEEDGQEGKKKSPKYISVKRSAVVPAWVAPSWKQSAPVLVFEGELDAALVHQEAGEYVNTLSTGSTSNSIPSAILSRMSDSLVFVVMDDDEAGRKKKAEYERTFPDWEVVDPPKGYKDAGEAFEHGVNLLEWVKGFLPKTILTRLERARAQASSSLSAKSDVGAVHTVVDDRPDQEELSDLEVFRRYSPKEPPLIAQDMPDYDLFCTGWREHSCEHCPHYVNSGTGLFCSMWEAVYPGVVTWHPMTF